MLKTFLRPGYGGGGIGGKRAAGRGVERRRGSSEFMVVASLSALGQKSSTVSKLHLWERALMQLQTQFHPRLRRPLPARCPLPLIGDGFERVSGLCPNPVRQVESCMFLFPPALLPSLLFPFLRLRMLEDELHSPETAPALGGGGSPALQTAESKLARCIWQIRCRVSAGKSRVVVASCDGFLHGLRGGEIALWNGVPRRLLNQENLFPGGCRSLHTLSIS